MEQQLTKKIETGFRLNPNNINRKGRPINPEKRALQNALRAAKRNNGNIEFLHHVANEAYKDKSVMLAVFDKLVPNATLPKEQDESTGLKQVIIIRADREEAKEVSRRVHIQPESIPCDVEFMGNRKDNESNPTGQYFKRSSE